MTSMNYHGLFYTSTEWRRLSHPNHHWLSDSTACVCKPDYYPGRLTTAYAIMPVGVVAGKAMTDGAWGDTKIRHESVCRIRTFARSRLTLFMEGKQVWLWYTSWSLQGRAGLSLSQSWDWAQPAHLPVPSDSCSHPPDSCLFLTCLPNFVEFSWILRGSDLHTKDGFFEGYGNEDKIERLKSEKLF